MSSATQLNFTDEFMTTTLRYSYLEIAIEKKLGVVFSEIGGRLLNNGNNYIEAFNWTLRTTAMNDYNRRMLKEILEDLEGGETLPIACKKQLSWEYRIFISVGDLFPDALPHILKEFPKVRLVKKHFDDFEFFLSFYLGCLLTHPPVGLTHALFWMSENLQRVGDCKSIQTRFAFSIMRILESLGEGKSFHDSFGTEGALHDIIDPVFLKYLENTEEMLDVELGKHLWRFATVIKTTYNRLNL